MIEGQAVSSTPLWSPRLACLRLLAPCSALLSARRGWHCGTGVKRMHNDAQRSQVGERAQSWGTARWPTALRGTYARDGGQNGTGWWQQEGKPCFIRSEFNSWHPINQNTLDNGDIAATFKGVD